MASRPRGYGFSAEVAKKIQAKYDIGLEQEARLWIEDIIGEPICPEVDSDEPLGHDRFHLALKDGQVLCRLINEICPGSVKKIHTVKINFKQMENIGNFLTACARYGLLEADQFYTAALYEKTDMTQVVNTLFALGRKAKANGFTGPSLGVKESAANPRHFSQEQLREGQTIIGLQMGSNRGANQQGLSFGKTRSITD